MRIAWLGLVLGYLLLGGLWLWGYKASEALRDLQDPKVNGDPLVRKVLQVLKALPDRLCQHAANVAAIFAFVGSCVDVRSWH